MSPKISVASIIAPHFYDVAWDIVEHRHTHYWLSGGRGSAKSSFASVMVVLLLIAHPQTHAAVLRKVGNTIKDSVYAQILWAVDALGLSAYFKATRSPMELVYRPTGQRILFRGADDPLKIKSIKAPFGYFGITWFEELDQFSGDQEIRSINQSLMRGGDLFWALYSYNPPKSRDNWVNVEADMDAPDRLVHRSTYLTMPRAWISDEFVAVAEWLKERRPTLYEHEYLGVPTGTGGSVFENIEAREITNEEIAAFDKLYYGLDFGFAVDPLVWCKLCYHPGKRTLYILDEIYQTRMSNARAVEEMKRHGTGHVYADSAEPRTIYEMYAMGLRVDPARKGPDSVEHGIKWLQDLDAIVIDKRRTPNAYREFTLYEYERNRAGEFISTFPDRNNHCIDAVRYALSDVMLAANKWQVVGVRF